MEFTRQCALRHIFTILSICSAQCILIQERAKKLLTAESGADSHMLLGYMLTYYSVQSTFPAACTTLALHGMAFSLVYATAIRSAQVSSDHGSMIFLKMWRAGIR